MGGLADKNRRKRHNRRRTVWERCNFRCHWCDVDLGLEQVTLDHVKPKSSGHNHGIDNLVASCADCNMVKGPRSAKNFAAGVTHTKTGRIRDLREGGWRKVTKWKGTRASLVVESAQNG